MIRLHLACLVWVLTLLPLASATRAQHDPYRKLLQPLEIASLGQLSPQKGICFIGSPGGPQLPDGSRLLAAEEGKGVINHIWMTVDHGVPDSTTRIRVVIDDITVIDTTLRGVGKLNKGFVRPPFDTMMSGGTVCDVQLPYTKHYQIYYTGPYLFCAIIWRPLPLDADIGSFTATQYRHAEEQASAENVYWQKESPWNQLHSDSLRGEWALDAGESREIASIAGPSFIHTLEFFNRMPWSQYHDSLYLQIYWDENLRPQIDLPLNDFFGFGNSPTKVNAFQQRCSNDQVLSYMPMPFTRSASVRLLNKSSRKLSIGGRLLWSVLDTAGKRYGVLATDFRRETPTKFEVDHKITEHLGRGRYIGCHTAVSNYDFHYFLEGDYQFHVDDRSWRYTGTEDYFNGAWYFEDSIFSLPFAGCTIFPSTFYRFHYLDAVDFTKSFGLSAEHGNLNGIRTDYRTTAFLYVEPQPIWAHHDTIVRGKTLRISGAGLIPLASYEYRLNGLSIGTSISSSEGRIDGQFTISLDAGSYSLTSNGIPYNRPIVVLSEPLVLVDTSNKIGPFNFRDKLPVRGIGFQPIESIELSVDTFLISNIIADAQGMFETVINVPYTPAFVRKIVAIGNLQSTGSSPEYAWSRTLSFEAEYQPRTETARPLYLGWWGHHWSQSMIAFLLSGDSSSMLELSFDTPIDDTFTLELFYTTNERFGNYDVLIDNIKLGLLEGYTDHDYEEPHRAGPLTLNPIYLTEGVHTLQFKGRGRHPDAVENSVGPDNFRLIPTTAFRPRSNVVAEPLAGTWIVNPSPMRGTSLTLSYTGSDPDLPADVVLRDALGRGIARLGIDVNAGSASRPLLRVELPSYLAPGAYFIEVGVNPFVKFIKVD
jgi:hypothetical protein